jgi:methyl coenzyme M reductase beta subunit
MDKDTQDISKSLAFIIERMLTKDDVREMINETVTPIVRKIINELVPPIVQKIVQDALRPVESKVSGIDKRLDIEAGHRDDMKLPGRVVDLEKKVFGKSREPEMLAQ